jgi:hypothetical protein
VARVGTQDRSCVLRLLDRNGLGFDDAKVGEFRDPAWELVEDLDGLLGCAAQTWRRGEYAVLAVTGPAGEAWREQLQANNRVTADRA